jgi:rhodanese-related sulfurtransferase
VLALALFALSCTKEVGKESTVIASADAKALVKNGATLLDVRTVEEFAAGHLEGALNIPVDELAHRQAELGAQKDKPVVVYCQSGRRSAKARDLLAASGFTQVKDLGGMSNWK